MTGDLTLSEYSPMSSTLPNVNKKNSVLTKKNNNAHETCFKMIKKQLSFKKKPRINDSNHSSLFASKINYPHTDKLYNPAVSTEPNILYKTFKEWKTTFSSYILPLKRSRTTSHTIKSRQTNMSTLSDASNESYPLPNSFNKKCFFTTAFTHHRFFRQKKMKCRFKKKSRMKQSNNFNTMTHKKVQHQNFSSINNHLTNNMLHPHYIMNQTIYPYKDTSSNKLMFDPPELDTCWELINYPPPPTVYSQLSKKKTHMDLSIKYVDDTIPLQSSSTSCHSFQCVQDDHLNTQHILLKSELSHPSIIETSMILTQMSQNNKMNAFISLPFLASSQDTLVDSTLLRKNNTFVHHTLDKSSSKQHVGMDRPRRHTYSFQHHNEQEFPSFYEPYLACFNTLLSPQHYPMIQKYCASKKPTDKHYSYDTHSLRLHDSYLLLQDTHSTNRHFYRHTLPEELLCHYTHTADNHVTNNQILCHVHNSLAYLSSLTKQPSIQSSESIYLNYYNVLSNCDPPTNLNSASYSDSVSSDMNLATDNSETQPSSTKNYLTVQPSVSKNFFKSFTYPLNVTHPDQTLIDKTNKHVIKDNQYFNKEPIEVHHRYMKLLLNKIPNLDTTHFELYATVGTGTFGRVRMAKLKGYHHTSPLALKILKKKEMIRLNQVEHVKSERAILERVQHPFIVNLFTAFQDHKRLYLVMEFVHGGELFNYLRNQKKFDANKTRFYASEVILALQYLHHLDIAYRDLKPENILIDVYGHIKMTDFGFAKIVQDRTWTICGTPEYLAPEIIQSKGHGRSVDWWALGILIYEMLVGRPPFDDNNSLGIYKKILLGNIYFPKLIDHRAKDLIKKLLSHDHTKRYGCLKLGAEDIKQHKWFKTINWTACGNRQLAPPFIPQIKSNDDTSMFDHYAESLEGTSTELSACEQEVFEKFLF